MRAQALTDAVKPFRTRRCAGGDKVAAVVVVVEAAGQCRECKITTRCYAQAQERACRRGAHELGGHVHARQTACV